MLYNAVLQGEGRVLFVRQIMRHTCYSERKRGRCGGISADSYSCGLQWRRPLLGALLFVGSPSRAITTRCRRRRNLGGKLLLILLLRLRLLRLLQLLLLLLLLEAVPVLRLSPPPPPLFPLSYPRYSSRGRCAFSVGVHLDLGTVVVVVVVVELVLLLLLLLLEAVLARAQAPPPPPPLPEVDEQRPQITEQVKCQQYCDYLQASCRSPGRFPLASK
jgi:hypothetical protein